MIKKIIGIITLFFTLSTMTTFAQTLNLPKEMTVGDSFEFSQNIDNSGDYYLEVTYVPVNESSEDIIYDLYIDDQKIASSLQLDKVYAPVTSVESFDRYGNEVPPEATLVSEPIVDASHYKEQYDAKGFIFQLDSGNHDVKIEITSGKIVLHDVKLVEYNIPSYSEYIGSEESTESNLITIEGEDFSYKNSNSIKPAYSGDIESYPYEYKNQLLNTLSGESFNKPSLSVSYAVDIGTAGYYSLGIKYKNISDTMPAHIQISINGEVPFEEINNYTLPFSEEYAIEIFEDDNGTPYLFYFDEGLNYITITLNFTDYIEIYNQITIIIDQINNLYLEVQKVTGSEPDPNTVYDLEKYLPGITEKSQAIYDEMLEVYALILEASNGVENKVSNYMNMAIETYEPFAYDVNSIANNLNLLYASTTSVASYLSTARNELSSVPLEIDQIYVSVTSENMPNYHVNIVKKVTTSIKDLIYSFKPIKADDEIEYTEEIEVWVMRGKQYVDQLQLLADEEFTKETGIKVNFSVMTTDQQLLLSNAAKNPPDIVLGLQAATIYEYGVRGAAVDLTQFEDFEEVASEYIPGTLIPYYVDSGMYGLPETLEFTVMYYRTDIVEEYNLEIPQTWADVAALMPILEQYSMTFYTTMSDGAGMKTFSSTGIFLLQSNCELYDEETLTTSINSSACAEAVNDMVELYTLYGLPLQIPNFFEYFRTGKAPMGIAGFGTYTQLLVAAPELNGKWDIAPIPGTMKEDGTIDRTAPVNSSGAMILAQSENIEESWEFLKWWLDTETQTTYAYAMYNTYGPAFLWPTANIESFLEGPFPADDKAVIVEQWGWAEEVARIPGSYMVERGISNTWNAAVFEDENVQENLEKSKVESDREIQDKMTEFGYMDEEGNIIEPYDIPTIEDIEAIIYDE